MKNDDSCFHKICTLITTVSLMILAITSIVTMLRTSAWPAEITEQTLFTFPIPYENCEVKHNKIVLSSYFTMKRADLGGKTYKAICIPAKKNSKVLAIEAGRITDIEYDSINGLTLTVSSERGQAKYCHLKKIAINSGLIKAGDWIADVGRSGRTTGYHLRLQYLALDGKPICITNNFGLRFYLDQTGTAEVKGAQCL